MVRVQWDELFVRLLDPKTGQLLREHVRQKRGWYRIKPEDHSKLTPLRTSQLLWRARRAGTHVGALCDGIHRQQREVGVRRILGVLSLAKKYGATAVEEACTAALEMGVQEYRFVRRYLERCPQAPLSLKQSRSPDPRAVSRPHSPTNQGARIMNLIELTRALKQLRLGGMA